jgi:hypothetical protein
MHLRVRCGQDNREHDSAEQPYRRIHQKSHHGLQIRLQYQQSKQINLIIVKLHQPGSWVNSRGHVYKITARPSPRRIPSLYSPKAD